VAGGRGAGKAVSGRGSRPTYWSSWCRWGVADPRGDHRVVDNGLPTTAGLWDLAGCRHTTAVTLAVAVHREAYFV